MPTHPVQEVGAGQLVEDSFEGRKKQAGQKNDSCGRFTYLEIDTLENRIFIGRKYVSGRFNRNHKERFV